jgi:protein-S-isoprenylcysteine O-methyltransferase Ste14
MAADRVGILVPPPVYPLLGLLAAFLLEDGWHLGGVPEAVRIAGAALALACIAFALWALATLLRHRTPVDPYRATLAIVTAGPYRWSRNPIYLAFAVAVAGIGLAAGWLWSLVVAPVVLLALYWFVVRKEEAYLAGKFGDEYAAYQAQVRRWL